MQRSVPYAQTFTAIVVLLGSPTRAAPTNTVATLQEQAGIGGEVSNRDVVRMVKAGLTDDVVITAINQAPRRRFDLSPDGLIELKLAHVPDAVIRAMQSADIIESQSTAQVQRKTPVDTPSPPRTAGSGPRLEPIDLSVTDTRRIGAGTKPMPSDGHPEPVATIRDGVLDDIVLYARTPPSPPTRIAIRLFLAHSSGLGTGDVGGKEDRQSEAKMIQSSGPKILAERFATKLRESGPYADVSILDDAAVPPLDTVIVEGRFTEIDPGSRAKRYFVGFGAGKSRIAVSGVVKSADGVLLATFAHKRIGVMGVYGGDSLGKLTSDTRDVGEDVAKFINAWATSRSLR